jgi:hypothetical protein
MKNLLLRSFVILLGMNQAIAASSNGEALVAFNEYSQLDDDVHEFQRRVRERPGQDNGQRPPRPGQDGEPEIPDHILNLMVNACLDKVINQDCKVEVFTGNFVKGKCVKDHKPGTDRLICAIPPPPRD